jgi:hypothetical protein
VFVVLFFVVLFIPMSNVNLGETSVKENRAIREYRPFFRDKGGISYDYPEDFERWFNDRFYKREEVIDFYSFVQFNINNRNKNRVSKRFFYGQDKWMFFRGDFDRAATIEHYQNIELFKQEQLEKIGAYLQSVNDWCEKNNKKFYFYIVPEKHRIYPEFFPFYIKKVFPDEKGKTYQLLIYLKKHTTVKVIYPDKILKENKKDGLLYWKADTHWNEMGAYWGYRSLMKEVSKDFDVKPFIVSKIKIVKHQKGDMGIDETQADYKIPDIKNLYVKNQNVFENKNGKFRLVFLGDSFSASILPYLGNTFRQVVSLWNEVELNYRDKTAIGGINNSVKYIKENADIVVLEMVERYIDWLDKYEFKENAQNGK